MGSTFPAISTVIASSTTDVSSLAGYLLLPLVALAFTVTVVVVAIKYVRKWLLSGVRKAAKHR